MDLNLDTPLDVEAALLPWDFSVTIDGVRYPTRAPMLGELVALDKLRASALHDVISGFFTGEKKPDVGTWDLVRLTRFMTGYVAAFTGHVAKKFPGHCEGGGNGDRDADRPVDAWQVVAAMLAAAPAYRIAELWRMRADVAFGVIAGRAALFRRAAKAVPSAGSATRDGESWPGPNGTTFTRIGSFETLKTVLKPSPLRGSGQ